MTFFIHRWFYWVAFSPDGTLVPRCPLRGSWILVANALPILVVTGILGVGEVVDPNWKCFKLGWILAESLIGEKSSKRFKTGILRAQHVWILPGSQRWNLNFWTIQIHTNPTGSHRIHVGYVYSQVVDFYCQCRKNNGTYTSPWDFIGIVHPELSAGTLRFSDVFYRTLFSKGSVWYLQSPPVLGSHNSYRFILNQLISSYDFEHETSGCERMFVLAYLGISSWRFDGGKGAMLDVPKESLISELLMDSIFNTLHRQKARMTMIFFVTVSFTVTAHDSLFWLLSIMILSYVIYVICRLFSG